MPVTRPSSANVRPLTVKPSATSAPAARAASTSSASSSVRRGPYIASTPSCAGYPATSGRVPASRRTRRTAGVVAATASSSPHRCRQAMPGVWTWCVESVSLGNRARSTASTDIPARASSMAVAAPAARAPTTTTSYTAPHLHTVAYG
jgi:hypothetical protein